MRVRALGTEKSDAQRLFEGPAGGDNLAKDWREGRGREGPRIFGDDARQNFLLARRRIHRRPGAPLQAPHRLHKARTLVELRQDAPVGGIDLRTQLLELRVCGLAEGKRTGLVRFVHSRSQSRRSARSTGLRGPPNQRAAARAFAERSLTPRKTGAIYRRAGLTAKPSFRRFCRADRELYAFRARRSSRTGSGQSIRKTLGVRPTNAGALRSRQKAVPQQPCDEDHFLRLPLYLSDSPRGQLDFDRIHPSLPAG